MKTKRFLHLSVGVLILGLAACGGNGELRESSKEAFDILKVAEPVPLVMTQALTAHSVLQTAGNGELSLSGEQVEMGDLQIYTLTAQDFKGYPFTNLNFTAPREIGTDIWAFADTLTGSEWNSDDFNSGWAMVLTGASDVRDTLLSVTPGLSYLMYMNETLKKLGGQSNLTSVISTDSQNFLLLDKQGNYWSIEEKRKLSAEELGELKKMYDGIYDDNNNAESTKQMKADWQEISNQSKQQQKAMGYLLTDLVNSEGGLDLQKTQALMDKTITPQWADERRECWLFVCSVVQWGEIRNMNNQVPVTYNSGKSGRYGGYKQSYDAYFRTGQSLFPTMVGCGLTNPKVSASLGCGPSSFQGLLQHQFQSHGKTFAGLNLKNTTVEAFDRWLVAPVGFRGRPRIANYMGTCKPPTTTESMTLGGAYMKGANDFLRDAKSDLKLIGSYSTTDDHRRFDAKNKANLIAQHVGRNENPVVAEYFRSLTGGHFSAIRQYRNMWQGDVEVTIKTVDDYDGNDRFYSLSSGWVAQTGVFTLVNK